MSLEIVAATGHRPDKLGGYNNFRMENNIKREMWCYLEELKPNRAISGMALGVDLWFAEMCIDLEIPFTAAVPFPAQPSKWPSDSQSYYERILAQAVSVVYVSEVNPETKAAAAWMMDKRNHWMVDHATRIAAVWNGSNGGTANCVRYAQSVNRRIDRLVFQ